MKNKLLVLVLLISWMIWTTNADSYWLDKERKCFNWLIEVSNTYFENTKQKENLESIINTINNSINLKILQYDIEESEKHNLNMSINRIIFWIINDWNYFSEDIQVIKVKSLFTLLLEKRLQWDYFEEFIERNSFCKLIKQSTEKDTK